MAAAATDFDLPRRPIDVVLQPIQSFLRVSASGGILLIACTIAALVWANSPWAASYEHFWHTHSSLHIGGWHLEMSLAHFVNDALMAIFFFVVGLEIKRELLVGELSSFRSAIMPAVAALGGMAVPALVYVAVVMSRGGGPALDGWAIPMATDIAFAVGIMAMLGRRVPVSLKIFLTALAIVDDLGAVAVIAIFYTSDIAFVTLAIATGMVGVSALANWSGVRSALAYGLIGLVIWLMLIQSGVHATVGGVFLAATIPSRVRINGARFCQSVRRSIESFEKSGGDADDILTNEARQSQVRAIEYACERAQTPLNRLEHGLHPWVAYFIMPVFALANAGVTVGGHAAEALLSPVGLGVALGLLIGKPVGVVVFTLLATRSGLAEPLGGVTPGKLLGAGSLAGIGFTMSLFIANLAFKDNAELLLDAKVGILSGSFLSMVLGTALLTRKPGDRGGG